MPSPDNTKPLHKVVKAILAGVAIFLVLITVGVLVEWPQHKHITPTTTTDTGVQYNPNSGIDLGPVITDNSSDIPAAQPAVLLDQSGSGSAQTKPFTASGDWTLTYAFDCTSFGYKGNFQAYISNTDGSYNTDTGANDLALSGGNTDYYYDSGEHYLQINSECEWHVTVKG